MGVACYNYKSLLKKNQELNKDLNDIIIKKNELEAKELQNISKIKELENNNELLKTYCINLQSQLLTLTQQNNLNWNYINNINVHGNINQFHMNLNSNANTNNAQPLIINMIFIINQKEKYILPVLSNYKLNDIFQYICSKLKYTININKIKFIYNTQDVTQYFFSNQEVSSLNIRYDNPIVYVTL